MHMPPPEFSFLHFYPDVKNENTHPGAGTWSQKFTLGMTSRKSRKPRKPRQLRKCIEHPNTPSTAIASLTIAMASQSWKAGEKNRELKSCEDLWAISTGVNSSTWLRLDYSCRTHDSWKIISPDILKSPAFILDRIPRIANAIIVIKKKKNWGKPFHALAVRSKDT